MLFRHRADAGIQLAAALADRELEAPIVLAIPRGGVPVGAEVARRIGAPLEVFVSRKIGAPGQAEYGIGAVAEGGGVVANRDEVRRLGLSDEDFARMVDAERRELTRRVDLYRQGRRLLAVEGRDVILVDDGLATGITAEAALNALRGHRPRLLVLAAPVCAPDKAACLRRIADDVVCVEEPTIFGAVGWFYEHFEPTSDDEVLGLLAQLRARSGAGAQT